MSHHLKSTGTYGVDDLGPFVGLSDFELLLEKDGSLLVGGLDYAIHEDMVRRGGRRVQERKEVNGLSS